MSRQVQRATLIRWLLAHGFELVEPRSGTGHSHYSNGATKITVAAHGPKEVEANALAVALRALEGTGFDRMRVSAELRAGKWARWSSGHPKSTVLNQ